MTVCNIINVYNLFCGAAHFNISNFELQLLLPLLYWQQFQLLILTFNSLQRYSRLQFILSRDNFQKLEFYYSEYCNYILCWHQFQYLFLNFNNLQHYVLSSAIYFAAPHISKFLKFKLQLLPQLHIPLIAISINNCF